MKWTGNRWGVAMKANLLRRWTVGVVIGLGTLWEGDAHAQPIFWSTTIPGRWSDIFNWNLLTAPTSTHTAVFITNATTKIETFDQTVATGNRTFSNLTVAGPNTLQITNISAASPMQILNGFTISTGGAGIITNAEFQFGQLGLSLLTNTITIDGAFTLRGGGVITVTNNPNTDAGSLSFTRVANAAGSSGTLTVAGGTFLSAGTVTVGGAANATGTVWLTGGQLLVTNSVSALGSMVLGDAAGSFGRLILSNGIAIFNHLEVGAGGTGTVTMAGGSLFVTNSSANAVLEIRGGTLTLGGGSLVINQLVMTNVSARLIQTNGTISINATNLTAEFDADGDGIANALDGNPFTPGVVPGGVNSWIFSSDGTWHSASKWSLTSTPHIVQSEILITNLGFKTVTIDATTASFISPMTISNLTVRSLVAGINTLFLNNAGTSTPLRVLNQFILGTNAVLRVTNSVLRVEGPESKEFVVDGTVTNLAGGEIITTNQFAHIASTAKSRATVVLVGGRWRAKEIAVGVGADSDGTLALRGGTNIVSEFMYVGASSTGTLWLTDGQLVVTNFSVIIGLNAPGRLTTSNGVFLGAAVTIGENTGAGTLTLAGGTNNFSNLVTIGENASATGAVWITGGAFQATQNLTSIGDQGVGQMTVSNGTAQLLIVNLGGIAGSRGTLTAAGGTTTIFSSLTLGTDCSSTGTVLVAGGALFVTNDLLNAKVLVNSGTLRLDTGTLTMDSLVLTNPCGRFIRTGGTLSITTTNLSGGLDADGDGMGNNFELSFGFDPFNPADAGNDPDGDGLSNLQEFQAGTNPTNSASFFGITSITQVSTNILINWTIGAIKTNALERTAGVAGSFSNNFATIFIATNSGIATATNYLDSGAATNVPAFYYRVRLVP